LICWMYRNSTVTLFAQKPEWTEALASELAEQMGHSVAVQKKFYKRVNFFVFFDLPELVGSKKAVQES